MLRRLAPIVPIAVLALLSCQDYRFHPVGRCLIQPGQVHVPVTGIATADILFLIDDSGSMDPMQANLARNFDAFISQLAATQAARVSQSLAPIDFHIAVTTSSVFFASAGTCNSSLVCSSGPVSNCAASGASCVGLREAFYQCGAPKDGTPFPAGDFVASGSNPKVLHFDFTPAQWASWGTGSVDPGLQTAVNQFKQNVVVGSCGSGMEQHFEGSRRAVQKALAGTQPGVAAGEWLHANSQIVVVWLGNEDDCSNPEDPNQAIVYSGNPGSDSCTSDTTKRLPIGSYASFFGGLGHPFSAAFIYGGTVNGTTFTPGNCACPPPQTGTCGFGPGTTPSRFHGLADAFRTQGSSVVEASICDAEFANALRDIADLVRPPTGVVLQTTPAAGVVTQLRILAGDGSTARVCVGPPPDPVAEWAFIDCTTAAVLPTGAVSKCINLIPGAGCEPSAGQTLVAEYLGRVPQGGCPVPAGAANQPSPECATALGGGASDWTCDGTPTQTGTCLCHTQ